MSLLALGLPLLAGGCAEGFKYSVLDPAPYRAMSNVCGGKTGTVSLPFGTFDVAAAQLCALSNDYADHADRLVRQRLALDLPALGLGVAAAANGAFRGAKDLTLALGIGGASLAGVNSYFTPQTRISAYMGAAKSLRCASDVAYGMGAIDRQYDAQAKSLHQGLADETQTAESLIANGKLATADAHNLIAARDAGTKAAADLDAAYGLLQAGPLKLQVFAGDVDMATSTRAMSGQQDVTAVLKLLTTQIGAAATPGVKPAAPAATPRVSARAAPPGGAAPSPAAPSVPTAAELIAELTNDAATAENLAKRINDAWSGFAGCTSN